MTYKEEGAVVPLASVPVMRLCLMWRLKTEDSLSDNQEEKEKDQLPTTYLGIFLLNSFLKLLTRLHLLMVSPYANSATGWILSLYDKNL